MPLLPVCCGCDCCIAPELGEAGTLGAADPNDGEDGDPVLALDAAWSAPAAGACTQPSGPHSLSAPPPSHNAPGAGWSLSGCVPKATVSFACSEQPASQSTRTSPTNETHRRMHATLSSIHAKGMTLEIVG
jgi:hypothetical protein